MNKVYIIHRWGGSPEEPMYKWIKSELEKNGLSVIVPKMPNPEEPEIESWTRKLRETVNLKDNNYFIGHSIGCQTILRYLEKLDEKIKVMGVVLIAPWMHLDEKTFEEEGETSREIAKPWMETPINWRKVKSHLENRVVCIFSDNDPFVPLRESDLFKMELNAKVIVEHNKGHFDPDSNVTKNPTAVYELLSMYKNKK